MLSCRQTRQAEALRQEQEELTARLAELAADLAAHDAPLEEALEDPVQAFFDTMPAPDMLEEAERQMGEFVAKHGANSTPVVVITSGGTRVPLERNAVRYLDNFSTGSRGALSAEFFLAQGYAVIFVQRTGSLSPFAVRHPELRGEELWNHLSAQPEPEPAAEPAAEPTMAAPAEEAGLLLTVPGLAETLQRRQAASEAELLLCVEFETLSEYLFMLRSSSLAVRQAGRNACLYLAAAVSDFYVSEADMPEHKMQSAAGPPEIKLQGTPKMLKSVRDDWAPEAFLVSFKLETDIGMLMKKSTGSIDKYGVDLVIGNILDTRKQVVSFVTATGSQQIWRSTEARLEAEAAAEPAAESEAEAEPAAEAATEKGEEYEFIEEPMIGKLAELHQAFITDNPVWTKFGVA